MSEDRSTLSIMPPEATPAPSLPPPETVNPLLPPAMTPAIGPGPVNPLAPTRTVTAAPLAPTRAVPPAAVTARESLFGPSGNPIQTYPFLAQQRARFKAELDQNPELKRQLAAVIDMENPTAGVAVAESLFNRMAMTGGTVASGIGMGNPQSFYGPVRRGSIQGRMNSLESDRGRLNDRLTQIDLALNGSNVTLGHTDQGSQGPPGGKPDPNYYTGGVGVNWAGERFNDFGGDPTSVARARQWRIQQQTQLGPEYGQAASAENPYDPSIGAPTKLTPGSYPGGTQIAQAGVSDVGPSGEPVQGQPGQQLPGQFTQTGMPQALTSGQMMALLFSMSAQRVQPRPVSYDPWSIERAAIEGTSTRFPMSAQQMSPVGGLGLSPYTTRVGKTVPGPA